MALPATVCIHKEYAKTQQKRLLNASRTKHSHRHIHDIQTSHAYLSRAYMRMSCHSPRGYKRRVSAGGVQPSHAEEDLISAKITTVYKKLNMATQTTLTVFSCQITEFVSSTCVNGLKVFL